MWKVRLIIRLIFYVLFFFFLNMSVSQSSLLYYLYFITFSSPVYSFSFFFCIQNVFLKHCSFFPYYFFLRFCIALDSGQDHSFLFLQFLYLFASCINFLLFFSHFFYYSLPIFIHNIAYTSDKNFCLLFLCNILLSSVFSVSIDDECVVHLWSSRQFFLD